MTNLSALFLLSPRLNYEHNLDHIQISAATSLIARVAETSDSTASPINCCIAQFWRCSSRLVRTSWCSSVVDNEAMILSGPMLGKTQWEAKQNAKQETRAYLLCISTISHCYFKLLLVTGISGVVLDLGQSLEHISRLNLTPSSLGPGHNCGSLKDREAIFQGRIFVSE